MLASGKLVPINETSPRIAIRADGRVAHTVSNAILAEYLFLM